LRPENKTAQQGKFSSVVNFGFALAGPVCCLMYSGPDDIALWLSC